MSKGAPNSRLTLGERQLIEKLLKQSQSCSHIAGVIGRSKNAVVVEVRRAGGRETYSAEKAQEESDHRFNVARFSKSRKLTIAHGEGIVETPYITLKRRLECLEMQLEILTEQIRKLQNEDKN